MLAMCLVRCLSPQPHPKLGHLCCERSTAFYRNHFASLRQLLSMLPIVPRDPMAVIQSLRLCALTLTRRQVYGTERVLVADTDPVS
jgi:hypothetical protein